MIFAANIAIIPLKYKYKKLSSPLFSVLHVYTQTKQTKRTKRTRVHSDENDENDETDKKDTCTHEQNEQNERNKKRTRTLAEKTEKAENHIEKRKLLFIIIFIYNDTNIYLYILVSL